MHAHELVSGALVASAASSVVFVVTAAVESASRSWRVLASSQFIVAATLVIFVSWSQPGNDHGVLVGVVAMAGLVAAVAAVWSGIRAFHDKPAPLPIVVAAPALVLASAGAADAVDADPRIAMMVAGLLGAAWCASSLYELQIGSWAQHPHARMLQIFLGGATVGGVVLGVLGWRDERAVVWSAMAVVALQVAVAMCTLVLQREKGRSWGHTTAETDNPLSDLDVLAPASFRFAAQGRLRRLGLVGGHACMILVSVEDLRALNSAFGRAVGDEAVRKLAETIRAHVPPWAPISHLGAGNFAVLAPAASPQTAVDIVTSIEAALLTSRSAAVAGIRIGAVYGVADTFTTKGEYAALFERAIASMVASPADLKTTS